MPEPIRGIHHITAIAGDPQRNLDFYTQTLGLRLVKLTVNFDDPGTYHFYFGDAAGQPGTILTFFPWTEIRRGRRGTGQVGMTAFNIPANAMGYWVDRLQKARITTGGPVRRFDEEVLQVLDPDGLALELIAAQQDPQDVTAWEGSPVPAQHAIRGFAAPTLLLEGFERTAEVLTGIFGMTLARQDGPRYRFEASAGPGTGNPLPLPNIIAGAMVDLEVRPNDVFGSMGAGVIHHIAFRARDDAEQLEYRALIAEHGLDVTPVLDRHYFRSIYFREPGGVLFEIATDPPGFTVDETLQTLGTSLKLPERFESRRATIEQVLPALNLPAARPLGGANGGGGAANGGDGGHIPVTGRPYRPYPYDR